MLFVRIFICLSILLCLSLPTNAQQQSLQQIEKDLQSMAFEILNHDSLEHKIAQNKKFAKRLINVLRRPESFSYDFDSLKTISILEPQDKSFRIFTWYIVDKNYSMRYGEQYHYYFGFIQRKLKDPANPSQYVVIPLIEMPKVPGGVENMILDNQNWMGALYYKPRQSQYINEISVQSYARERKASGKAQKVKQKYYVLSGWNGNDHRSNYKLVDVLSFDKEEPTRAIFGAYIFFFDEIIPKSRALFKYSEYAPFSLNSGYVKWGPGKLFKREMLIYDHLARPNSTNTMSQVWEMGPDGSYDGLEFIKKAKRINSRRNQDTQIALQRVKGYYKWHRNVKPATKYNNQLTQKHLDKIKREESARQKAAGIKIKSDKKSEDKKEN